MAAKRKTLEDQDVATCNELARMLYSGAWDVPKGYRFDLAVHPEEAALWRTASMAFAFVKQRLRGYAAAQADARRRRGGGRGEVTKHDYH